MTIDISLLSADYFRPHIGTTFQLLLPEGALQDIVLREIEENPRARMPKAPPERRLPFSLLLVGDPNQTLISAVVSLQHGLLGAFPALLVSRITPPEGVFDPHAWYQISFN